MRVYTSRRREWEFGISFAIQTDWIDESTVGHIRFSFCKRALVFAFRGKAKK